MMVTGQVELSTVTVSQLYRTPVESEVLYKVVSICFTRWYVCCACSAVHHTFSLLEKGERRVLWSYFDGEARTEVANLKAIDSQSQGCSWQFPATCYRIEGHCYIGKVHAVCHLLEATRTAEILMFKACYRADFF